MVGQRPVSSLSQRTNVVVEQFRTWVKSFDSMPDYNALSFTVEWAHGNPSLVSLAKLQAIYLGK